MGEREDLKKACRDASSGSGERFAKAKQASFLGRAARADKGYFALEVAGRTLTFHEDDVLSVSKTKDGHFRVTTGADAIIEVATFRLRRVKRNADGATPTPGRVARQGRGPGGAPSREDACSQHAFDQMLDAIEANENITVKEAEDAYNDAYDDCMKLMEWWDNLITDHPWLPIPRPPEPAPPPHPGIYFGRDGLIYWYPPEWGAPPHWAPE